MTLKLHIPEKRDLRPRLVVFGIGGAGGNAVNNMIASSLEGVDFVVANTDAQALARSTAENKIQLGEELTEGLGAGADPEIGASAAEESLEQITDLLLGSHMCFITAGMGGGTGTGAAPVVAQAARQLGILTVGVVTKPFQFEGLRRMRQAEEGINQLQQYVDTLIVIPNQNLFRLANEKTSLTDAFGMADEVLYQGVKGVTDLMVKPGLVNLDFADIRTVMNEMGKAMMGTGEAEGEDRAVIAAERAVANPLLDEVSLQGARGVLINITGGEDMSLYEVDEASNKIREQVDQDANIIFGSTTDPELNGRIRVSVVATGIDTSGFSRPSSEARRSIAAEEAGAREASRESARDEQPDATPDLFNSPVKGEDEGRMAPGSSRRGRVIEGVADDQTHMDMRGAPSIRDERDEGAGVYSQGDEGFQEGRDHAMQADYHEDEEFPPEEGAEDEFDDLREREDAPRRELPGSRAREAGGSIEDGTSGAAEPAGEKRARLQAAVERRQPAAPPAAPRAASPTRFSIDSVIKRMTGHGERADPPMASTEVGDQADHPDERHESPESEMSARDEGRAPLPKPQLPKGEAAQKAAEEARRVDIPAFLRRQAN